MPKSMECSTKSTSFCGPYPATSGSNEADTEIKHDSNTLYNPYLHLTSCVGSFRYVRAASDGWRLREALTLRCPLAGELTVMVHVTFVVNLFVPAC